MLAMPSNGLHRRLYFVYALVGLRLLGKSGLFMSVKDVTNDELRGCCLPTVVGSLAGQSRHLKYYKSP
ncbi:hypothetical protein IF2G_03702 [Cordyceps javanica]|nr:hypothetical protein IF2G_03702 [Cordyceps javanica]